MVDKFGGIGRKYRGPPGPPGKNALELETWAPHSVLRMFRENEVCTFYCNTAEDGILYDGKEKPIGLKDRYTEFKPHHKSKKHAICLQNFQKPIKLDTKYYGIPLKNSLYKISHIPPIATAQPSIVVFAFSFRADSTLTDEDDYIFTNKNTSRGVTISRNAVNILGAEAKLELHYDREDWNTMIIQYSFITDLGKDQCFFILNERRGFFTPRLIKKEERDLYIGGHPEKRNFGNVVLGSFEVYTKEFDILSPPSNYVVPNEIIKVLQQDISYRVN